MGLSDDVAILEEAHEAGQLRGRDLEVIRMQVARAEAKILEATAASVLLSPIRRMLLPDEL